MSGLRTSTAAAATSVLSDVHALFLLSNFLYFGNRQIRELLKSLYRDLYRYPIIEGIRRSHYDTLDPKVISDCFQEALGRTLFLGVGNPSESGSHLLYYFRQENGLSKSRFDHTYRIFERKRLSKWRLLWNLLFRRRDATLGTLVLRYPDIDRYVLLDDFCGSGEQGESYSHEIVEDIKRLKPSATVAYFVLFATSNGIAALRSRTAFDSVKCVFELDSSFRCFDAKSRYFVDPPAEISSITAESLCRQYGGQLVPSCPLGYGDCQLLIGFHHNTPDNTLPIFWYVKWTPFFVPENGLYL